LPGLNEIKQKLIYSNVVFTLSILRVVLTCLSSAQSVMESCVTGSVLYHKHIVENFASEFTGFEHLKY